jgi:hypothetical protein
LEEDSMKLTRCAIVASAAMAMALVGFGATGAAAAPTNAPSVRTGFLECGSAPLDFTFTGNSGYSQAAVTWSPLNLTFQYLQFSGTGIFIPTAYNVILSSGGQTSQLDVIKGNDPGTQSCVISETGPGFSLFGVVTGRIVGTPVLL